MPVETTRLVLWDLDHTLLETRGVGTDLFRLAFQQATGHELAHHIEVTGRTEPAIFAEAVAAHGLTLTDELMARYCMLLADAYRTHAVVLAERGRALPGAAAAIDALARYGTVRQTVLTGNLRAVAAVKLEVCGLAGTLDLNIGAYGDDDPVRSNLVPIARRRAQDAAGISFTAPVVLIGDTVNDVEAARVGDARIVAVATGRYTRKELVAAGADAVLSDLADTSAVVTRVLAA